MNRLEQPSQPISALARLKMRKGATLESGSKP